MSNFIFDGIVSVLIKDILRLIAILLGFAVIAFILGAYFGSIFSKLL